MELNIFRMWMHKVVMMISSYTAARSVLYLLLISPVSPSAYLSHPYWKLHELVDALKGILYANAAVYCTYPTGRLTLTQRTLSGLGTHTTLQPSRPPDRTRAGWRTLNLTLLLILTKP